MGKRLIVGTSLGALLVALLLLDGWIAPDKPTTTAQPETVLHWWRWLSNGAICTLLVLIMTLLTARELVRFAVGRGYAPYGRTAGVFAVMLVLGPYVSYNLSPVTGGYDESWGMFWMTIAVAVVFMLQALRHGTRNTMENTAITVFIMFYAGGLAGFMTKLRMEVGGRAGVAVLLFSMLLVKMADVGAYFTGRAIGKHKMVPSISPKKTWEGFAGGMVFTIVVALAVGHWLHTSGIVPIREQSPSHFVILGLLGLLLGLFSVAGDLCASLLKRDAEVKDSGRSLPGLGGVLDVFDSPLLAAPIAWFFWTRLFHVAT